MKAPEDPQYEVHQKRFTFRAYIERHFENLVRLYKDDKLMWPMSIKRNGGVVDQRFRKIKKHILKFESLYKK